MNKNKVKEAKLDPKKKSRQRLIRLLEMIIMWNNGTIKHLCRTKQKYKISYMIPNKKQKKKLRIKKIHLLKEKIYKAMKYHLMKWILIILTQIVKMKDKELGFKWISKIYAKKIIKRIILK